MTIVIAVAALVIIALVGAFIREIFKAPPEFVHVCDTCGTPLESARSYCDRCLSVRLRDDVARYRRRTSEKAGELGSAPALAPTPKDLRPR